MFIQSRVYTVTVRLKSGSNIREIFQESATGIYAAKDWRIMITAGEEDI